MHHPKTMKTAETTTVFQQVVGKTVDPAKKNTRNKCYTLHTHAKEDTFYDLSQSTKYFDTPTQMKCNKKVEKNSPCTKCCYNI